MKIIYLVLSLSMFNSISIWIFEPVTFVAFTILFDGFLLPFLLCVHLTWMRLGFFSCLAVFTVETTELIAHFILYLHHFIHILKKWPDKKLREKHVSPFEKQTKNTLYWNLKCFSSEFCLSKLRDRFCFFLNFLFVHVFEINICFSSFWFKTFEFQINSLCYV